MKEELISFETAKLAKEKGFNIPSHSYYFEDGEFKEFKINDTYGYYGDEYTVSRDKFYTNWNDKWKTTKEGDRCFGCDKNPKYLETFSAPTQALLQKWLREKHGIYLEPISKIINSTLIECVVYIKTLNGKMYSGEKEFHNWKSRDYSTALEKGLQEGLKLIS